MNYSLQYEKQTQVLNQSIPAPKTIISLIQLGFRPSHIKRGAFENEGQIVYPRAA